MNNKFKRALSSILAFVMMCSCFVVMNVSGVFAGTSSWSANDYDKDSTLDANTYLINDDNLSAYIPNSVKVSSTTDTNYVSSAQNYIQFRGNTTITSKTDDINGNQYLDSKTQTYPATTVVFTPKVNGTITFNVGLNSGKTSYIWDNTDGKNVYNTTTTAKSLVAITADVEANHDYLAYATGTTGYLFSISFSDKANVDVESISLSDTSVEVGKTTTLTPTFTPTNATNKSVTWKSDNDSIATVSDAGIVTGVAEGVVTITATTDDGSKTATASVTVTSATATSTVVYKFYASNSDMSANEDSDFSNNTTIFGNTTSASNDWGSNISPYTGTIADKDYTISKRTGTSALSTTKNVTINVPQNVTNANFYIVAASSGSSARTLTLTDSNENVINSSNGSIANTTPALVSFQNLTTGTYTLKTTGNTAYGLLLLECEVPTSPTSASTSIALDFRNGELVTSDDTAPFYFKDNEKTDDTSNYDVKIENMKLHSSYATYGLSGVNTSSKEAKITLNNISAPVKITLATTNYAGVYNAESSASDGKFITASGEIVTQLSNFGTNGKTVDYYYTGSSSATITLTAAYGTNDGTTQRSDVYLAAINVETVDTTPDILVANKNVTVTVTNALTGDIVKLTDVKGNVYTATLDSSSKADFSGSNVAIGDATITASGYTIESNTITITNDTNDYTVTATSTATETIPDGSLNTYLYVGYKAQDGYKVYSTVQAAVNAASAGDTIKVAEGTFKERVVVETANITINGSGSDKTTITYNDNESNNDTYFHGATLAVVANGFKANNIKIANTANDEGESKNATAFSLGHNYSGDASAEFTNCVIYSQRDTVMYGTKSSHKVVFDSCTIYGFQDVVCGLGNVTLTNCTWNVNNTNAARLFAAKGGSTCKATNLTIDESSVNKGNAVFARVWAQKTTSSDSSVIIDGYTDNNGVIASNQEKWSSNKNWNGTPTGDVVNGFDTLRTGSEETTDDGDCTKMLWLAKANGSDYFKTTLATIDKATSIKEVEKESADSNVYRIIGKLNVNLTEDDISDKLSSIGFVISFGNNSALLANTKIYNIESGDDAGYYTVNFVDSSNTETSTYNIVPYANYNNYDIIGGTATEQTIG